MTPEERTATFAARFDVDVEKVLRSKAMLYVVKLQCLNPECGEIHMVPTLNGVN